MPLKVFGILALLFSVFTSARITTPEIQDLYISLIAYTTFMFLIRN